MFSWFKISSLLFFAFSFFTPNTNGYINVHYPKSATQPQNVPMIETDDYQVIPFIWDPSSKILNFCIQSDDIPVNTELIQDAFDNINSQLFTGSLSTTSLFFSMRTNTTCKETDLKIIFVKSNNTKLFSPGYCTRRFLDGTINRPMILYLGCDITLNLCALQSSASMYNVLLHELLHVVGLDHPEPPVENAVISYGVRVNDSSLMNIYQDAQYMTLNAFDIMNMRFIALRDFPDSTLPDPRLIASYVPKIDPLLHVSGNNTYQVNTIMNVEQCWMDGTTKNPTLSPSTYTINPTMNPSMVTISPTITTISPTIITLSPTIETKPPTRKTNKKRKRRKFRRRRKKQNAKKKSNTTIETIASPEIFVDEATDLSKLNISTNIQPDITIDLLDGDVSLKTIVSPKIDLSGDASNYNIITEINPIINIRNRQKEVLPPPKQWDRYP
jgi:hypothetical protein